MTEVADLTVRRTRAVAVAKSLAMIAIIATAVTVSIVVRYLGDSRDGWKAVAEQEAAANADLRARLEASDTELACRSSAASDESAAMGELTIHIGETAEAALRLANGERISAADITALVTALHGSSGDVRAATQARADALDQCATSPPTTSTSEGQGG